MVFGVTFKGVRKTDVPLVGDGILRWGGLTRLLVLYRGHLSAGGVIYTSTVNVRPRVVTGC